MPESARYNEYGARGDRRRTPALPRYDSDVDLDLQDMKKLIIVGMALPGETPACGKCQLCTKQVV